jgi:hypothetical protein
MRRVLRVRIRANPTRIDAPSLGWVWEGHTEAVLLHEARAEFAAFMGVLPEQVRLVAFRDVSWTGEDP